MANISQEVNMDILEKLADGNYKKKNPSTTKEQVGLGDVDNVKQMPISGGVLEDYSFKTVRTDGEMDFSLGNSFIVDSYNRPENLISITTSNLSSSEVTPFILRINLREGYSLKFDNYFHWKDDVVPSINPGYKSHIFKGFAISKYNIFIRYIGEYAEI